MIVIDLQRTVIDNPEFTVGHKTGQNRLYNVLKAYASLD